MRFVLLAAAVAVTGCHYTLNDPGTDPPVRQFYFPTGIAYDSVVRDDGVTGRYLYITNANADLRFGGGLVQLVDVHRFDCAVDLFCNCPDKTLQNAEHQLVCSQTGCNRPLPENDDCSPDDINQASSDLLLIHDANAHPNYDVPECQPDPLDPSIVDCDETPFVIGNSSVRVGNFAGAVRVYNNSGVPDRGSMVPHASGDRRLFVGVRGDPSVTFIDVHLGPLASPGPNPKPGDVLDCFDHNSPVTARSGYDVAHNNLVHASGCDSSHVIGTYYCDGTHGSQAQPGCAQNSTDIANLQTEPFGMALDTGLLANGDPYANLLVSHLSTGQVSLIDAMRTDPQTMVRDVSPSFFATDPTGHQGAFSLAPQHPGNPASLWYLTTNLQPTIGTFRVAEVGVVVPALSFNIGGAFALGTDVRDILFEPGGDRAFLTEANPPSVLVVDTRVTDQRNPGQALNQLVEIVDVCQTPSHMGARRGVVPGAPGTPARIRTDLYVVCFLSDEVMVVDPDSPGVQDTILMGRGPNDIAFNFGDDGDPAAPPAPPARRAWVTQYAEMTIGELDLQPGSPTQNRLVARIGKPVPPPTSAAGAYY